MYGSGRVATNDKVAKLARLVNDAAYEYVVISDSDVRVRPDYIRQVIAPLRDPKVGATTCMYVPTDVTTLTDRLQTIGMMSDFYAGVLVDWQLEGIKFALGPTIATTRTRLSGFGGYASWKIGPPMTYWWGGSSRNRATKWCCCVTPSKRSAITALSANCYTSVSAGSW